LIPRARFAIPAQRSSEQQAPEALRALQKEDVEHWWPIIKANIKVE
jgi:hypothetical protein